MEKPRTRVQQSDDRARVLAERRSAPALRYYRVQDLLVRYCISRKTLWTWWAKDVMTPRMPAPVAISPAVRVWPADAIEQWEDARGMLPAANCPRSRPVDFKIGLKSVRTEDEAIELAKLLLRAAMPTATELTVYNETGKEVAVVYWDSHGGNLGGTPPEIRVRKNP